MSYIKILLMTLSFFPFFAWAHGHPAYSHENWTNTNNSSWMFYLSDDIPIRKISMIGTHDTMAYSAGGAFYRNVETQTLPLLEQLKLGIRAFDIRCRHYKDSFEIHHDLFYLNANFDDVLSAMTKFLNMYPSETLLVRIKEEYKAEGNTRPFDETFEAYRKKYPKIWRRTSDNPRLTEVRGKIVILQNFFGGAYGLDYPDSFNVQDQYSLRTNWDLYDHKWIPIRKHLDEATANADSGSYINYLSASGGSFPFFVASGHVSEGTYSARLSTGLTTPGWKNSYPDFPRVSCFIGICTIAFEGTNILTYEYIKSKNPKYVGIIMADFHGDGLVNEIIKLNYSKCMNWTTGEKGAKGSIYQYPNPNSHVTDYFKLKKDGSYGYFPTNRLSNDDWVYLGTKKVCK